MVFPFEICGVEKPSQGHHKLERVLFYFILFCLWETVKSGQLLKALKNGSRVVGTLNGLIEFRFGV